MPADQPLRDDHRATLTSTSPALRENSLEIVERCLERLTTTNEELATIISEADLIAPNRLAHVLSSYAKNVGRQGVVTSGVESLATQLTRIGVAPEHYSVIAEELIGATGDVLGAIPDHVVAAWSTAFQELAELFASIASEHATEAA